MELNLKLTIITVVYNGERYLRQTIDSVACQLEYVYEYLIIDGGSTDRTLGIVGSYRKKFNQKLKVVSEPDKGIYDAMNKGIRMAAGDVIGIINSDDFYEPESFKHVLDIFEQDDHIGCVYSDVNRISDAGFLGIVHGTEKLLKIGMSLNHPSCFIKKNVYKQIGGYDTAYRISADYDLALRMQQSHIYLKKSPWVLSNYRDGGCSMVNAKKGIIDTYHIHRRYFNILHAVYYRVKATLRLKIKGATF